MPRYKIRPQDITFAAEFLAEPFGNRSPGLQRVLNVLRGQGPEGKYVLICKEPYKRWTLGKLPARRGQPVEEIASVEYTDLASAERDVFRKRWRENGGPDLNRLLSITHPRV
jgi:hypothetical protein